MSHIQKLIDLAQTLPFDADFKIDEDMIIETFRPMDVCHQRFNLEEINKHIGIKMIFANTTDSQKYGDLLKLVYLDGEPMMMIDNHGKWLATKSIYYFSLEQLKTIRDFFNEHSTSVFEGMELGPALVTETMLVDEQWWNGRLTTEEGYPHIQLN